MGSLFSSSYYQQETSGNRSPINQMYSHEFGYAPIGPVGTMASIPKRHLYNSGSFHHPRRRY
jgi:hypothetical protein